MGSVGSVPSYLLSSASVRRRGPRCDWCQHDSNANADVKVVRLTTRALSHAGRVKLGRWPQKIESLVMKYDRVQESKKSPPSTRSTSRAVMRVRDSDSGRRILASSSSESELVGVNIC